MDTAHLRRSLVGRRVRRALLAWYRAQGRDLPWRHTRDPYAVLVSEIMLQQQSVVRVVPVYRAFLERFPDLATLAAASRADVVRVWSAIGLNRQALRLQEIARAAIASRSGTLPRSAEQLRRFKGVGRYTAAAVLCFAHGRREAMVDTNIRRVLSRLFGPPHVDSSLVGPSHDGSGGSAGGEQLLPDGEAWLLAGQLLPRRRQDVYDWNQGLMDLGATVCRARAPKCGECPVRRWCASRERSGVGLGRSDLRSPHPIPLPEGEGGTGPLRVAEERSVYAVGKRKEPRRHVGSARWLRGQVVRALAALPAGVWLSVEELAGRSEPALTEGQLPLLLEVLEALEKAGLVVTRMDAGVHTACALADG